MAGWEKLKFAVAAAGVASTMAVLHWVTGLVYPETYLAVPAYKVPGVSVSPVDLASLQRSWPAGLREQGGRATVRGYMSNIEKVAVPTSPDAAPALAAPAPPVDLGTALAAADVAKGRQSASVCTSCHTFEQGGQDRTGPGLWNVVGRDVASHGSFAYSSALAAQPGSWSYQQLDRFLANPAKAVPGTKMAFVGIRRAQDRANVIAFLSTLSASPVPFPKPETAAAPVGEQALASNAKGAPPTTP